MAINDILPSVDLLPGLADNRRQNVAPTLPAEGREASEYRKALSRTLGSDRRGEQTSPAAPASLDEEQPAPAEQGENGRPVENRSTPDQPAPPKPAEAGRDVESKTDRSSSVDSAPLPALPKTENHAESADGLAIPPVDLDELPQFDSVPVVDFVLVGDQLPSPPPDLSLLFGPPDDAVINDGGVQTDSPDNPPDEAAPLAPPAGLFQSLVTAAIAEKSDTPRPAAQPKDASPLPGVVVVDVGGEQMPDVTPVPAIAGTVDLEKPAEVVSRETPQASVPGDDFVPNPTEPAPPPVDESAAIRAAVLTGEEVRQPAPPAQPEQRLEAPPETQPRPLPERTPISTQPVRGRDHTSRKDDESSPRLGDAAAPGAIEAGGAVTVTTDAAPARAETVANTAVSGIGESEGAAATHPVRGDATAAPPAPVVGPPIVSTNAPRDAGFATPISNLPAVDAGQFVERVAAAVQSAPQNGQQMRIRLSPPHLGPLHISVTSHEGTISVQMEVQTTAARSALHDNMPLLREALVQHGSSPDRLEVQLVEPSPEDGRSGLEDNPAEQGRQQQRDAPPQDEPDEQPDDSPRPDGSRPAMRRGMDRLDIQV